MEHKLVSKNSFSLVEMLVVLLVIGLFGVLGLSLSNKRADSIDLALQKFDSFYKYAKTNNFLSGVDRDIVFKENSVMYRNKKITISKNIVFSKTKITLKSDGYVAPTTINVYENGELTRKIIFSLGFGVYRIEK